MRSAILHGRGKKLSIQEMEKKRLKCWEWKVQISDCRYRPLEQIYDHYSPQKKQTIDDYYIHPNWSDNEIKQFRKNVRRQNICVRHGFAFYSRDLEQKRVDQTLASGIEGFSPGRAKTLLNKGIISDHWYPDRMTLRREGTCGPCVILPKKRHAPGIGGAV